MKEITERPQFVTDEHLTYLDDLRPFGAINMYNKMSSWLKVDFGLDKEIAKKVVLYWMKTFSERQRG